MDRQRCRRCGQIKMLDRFGRRADAASGRKSHCRECERLASAARRRGLVVAEPEPPAPAVWRPFAPVPTPRIGYRDHPRPSLKRIRRAV